MGIWGGGLERQLRRVAGLREGTRCARRACARAMDRAAVKRGHEVHLRAPSPARLHPGGWSRGRRYGREVHR